MIKKSQVIEWIGALRSGNYKKGRNYLKTTNDNYCCLGVLGEILTPDQWRKSTSASGSFSLGETYSTHFPSTTWIVEHFGEESLKLAQNLFNRWAGMNDNVHYNPATHADEDRFTFNDIADDIYAALLASSAPYAYAVDSSEDHQNQPSVPVRSLG